MGIISCMTKQQVATATITTVFHCAALDKSRKMLMPNEERSLTKVPNTDRDFAWRVKSEWKDVGTSVVMVLLMIMRNAIVDMKSNVRVWSLTHAATGRRANFILANLAAQVKVTEKCDCH